MYDRKMNTLGTEAKLMKHEQIYREERKALWEEPNRNL